MSESIDDAIASLEGYLRRYPSGHFAELAQSRLERLLASRGEQRIAVVSAEDNPFTKGYAAARTDYRVGDRYMYRIIDLNSGHERRHREVVTAVTEFEVVYNDGKIIRDLLGNAMLQGNGQRNVDNQTRPAEYAVGKKWVTRFESESEAKSRKGKDRTEMALVVVAREEIVVPAGRFNAFRVEGKGWTDSGAQREVTFWMAPGKVRRDVAIEVHRRRPGNKGIGDWERRELVGFREAR